MKIKYQVKETKYVPEYANEFAAGADLKCRGDQVLFSGTTKIIPTGVSVEIPSGYKGVVSLRSGFASKNPVGISNGVGKIDSDYRGEIGVILHNYSFTHVQLKDGERFAQIEIEPTKQAEFEYAQEISETERGSGGFGSTGA